MDITPISYLLTDTTDKTDERSPFFKEPLDIVEDLFIITTEKYITLYDAMKRLKIRTKSFNFLYAPFNTVFVPGTSVLLVIGREKILPIKWNLSEVYESKSYILNQFDKSIITQVTGYLSSTIDPMDGRLKI